MHPKNIHNQGYPIAALCRVYPELKSFVIKAKSGNDSIDFTNTEAVKALNAALLFYYYDVTFWQLPQGYLCPPVPGRADYVHGIAELLVETGISSPVKGLDIGIGANAIYPIIGIHHYQWNFVGSDIDGKAVDNASLIAASNPHLSKHLSVRKQRDRERIFDGIIGEKEVFTFTMCNPPFHKSAEDALQGTQRKNKNLARNKGKRAGQGAKTKIANSHLNFAGRSNELWCEGGELAFIQRMIKESAVFKSQVTWFTCLVSKSEHLKPIENSINYYGATQYKCIDMEQGSKRSRFVAWSFM